MNITKETIADKIEFQFRIYEKWLISEHDLQYRELHRSEMRGSLFTYNALDLISDETYDELYDRVNDIFKKLASTATRVI